MTSTAGALAARLRQTVVRLPYVRWAWVRRAAVLDVLVAVITTGVEIGLIDEGSLGVTAAAVLLTVLAGVLLTLRRRFPLLVLGAAGALTALLVVIHAYPGGAPVIVAMYTVAELRERRLSLAALVPTAVLLQVGSVSSPPIAIGAWALGAYVQTRHRYTAALEERAAQLERERDQLDQIAAQRERASIARELHDIVAHSVTVMLLGARGARDVLRTSPDVAEDTLRAVETNAEQSIAELRRILAVLRSPDQVAEVRPAPALADLGELIAGYRTAGLPVTLRVHGPARPLPSGVELSVYRIVEEALTNVLKHARPSEVAVELRFHDSTLEVAIEDDGATPAASQPTGGPGHGILGMRERVTALGGVFEAQERAGGGFRVGACFPNRHLGDRWCGVTIRVLIADDQELVRTGLRLVLQAYEDIDVVGEASDGRQAWELAEKLRPDVVLMDIRMPRMDGIEATARLSATALDPAPRVLMLTTFDLDEYVFGALRAGAAGFVLKDASRERLVDAIRVVNAGEALLSPSITRRLIEEFASRTDPLRPPDAVTATLTPREREALGLLARGLSNVEIAQRLYVTEATVKSHVSSVLAKLGLRDRVQAVVFAYENGLVVAGDAR